MVSLRQATTRGVMWSGLATWGEQVIALLVIFVLARLLEPKDFGIVAFAGVFAFFCQALIGFTLNIALVQRKTLDEQHLDSAFWMILGFALLVAALLIITAGPLSVVLGLPALAAVLPWLSLCGVFHALHCVQESHMMRQMQFKRIAIRALTAIFTGGGVGIAMAYHGFGYWSIVAQLLTQGAVSAALMWSMSPWRPALRFSRRHAGEVLKVAKYVSGTGVLSFVNERGDAFLIGYFLGPAPLGLYNIGRRLLRILMNVSTGALVRVVFSPFSRLQDDPQRLRMALRETLRFSSLVMLPALVGLAVVAEEAVHALLGAKWLEATDIVRFLAIAGMAQFVSFLNISVVVACGKAHWHFYLSLVYMVMNMTAVFLAVPYGIVAVAGALAAVIVLREPFTVLLVRRVVPIRVRDYAVALGPSAAGSLIMAAAVYAARAAGGDELSPALALPAYVVLGAAIYAATICLVAPSLTREALSLARKTLSRGADAVA